MAITFTNQPDLYQFSQSNCDWCLEMDSDLVRDSPGVAHVTTVLVNPPGIVAGDTFTLNGTVFTWVANPTSNPREIYINPVEQDLFDELKQKVEALFPNHTFDAVFNTFVNGWVLTGAANNPGVGSDITWEFTGNNWFFLGGQTPGEDPTLRTCQVQYEVLIGGIVRETGVVTPVYTQSTPTDAFSLSIVANLKGFIKNYRNLTSSLTEQVPVTGITPAQGMWLQPSRIAEMTIRARECCEGANEDWSYADLTHAIHGSCDCNDEYSPPQRNASWLNFIPDNEGACIYDNSSYLLSFAVQPGGFFLVAGGINSIDVPEKGILVLDLVAFLKAQFTNPTVGFTYTITLVSSSSTPTSKQVQFVWKGGGCCGYVQFLTCHGTYQTLYVGCELKEGVRVQAKSIINCENCGNAKETRQSRNREYLRTKEMYTDLMAPSEANLRVLQEFYASSDHFYEGEHWEIEPSEYIYKEKISGKVRGIFTLVSRSTNKSLNNW